jgi:hypothetical protein
MNCRTKEKEIDIGDIFSLWKKGIVYWNKKKSIFLQKSGGYFIFSESLWNLFPALFFERIKRREIEINTGLQCLEVTFGGAIEKWKRCFKKNWYIFSLFFTILKKKKWKNSRFHNAHESFFQKSPAGITICGADDQKQFFLLKFLQHIATDSLFLNEVWKKRTVFFTL